MATCASCGLFILFGGEKRDKLRFCSTKCADGYRDHQVYVPDDVLEKELRRMHQMDCPACAGRGPLDVYTSQRIWSFLLVTSVNSPIIVACHSCGVKHHLKGIVFSSLLGWWAFPAGPIVVPIQIVRNAWAIIRARDHENPSAELKEAVLAYLSANAVSDLKGSSHFPGEAKSRNPGNS